MILYEIVGSESHQSYTNLSIDNLNRQYDFLRSVVNAAIDAGQPMISSAVIKALNFHAVACLHVSAGEYRPCPVQVGDYVPPEHFQVPELMNMLINELNYRWRETDPLALAAYALWRLNAIHPFINGNGRTARALCHYIVCVRAGGWLPGDPILPELIRQNRDEYVELLKSMDARFPTGEQEPFAALHAFLVRLMRQQAASV